MFTYSPIKWIPFLNEDSLKFRTTSSPEALDFSLLDKLLLENSYNKDLLSVFKYKRLPTQLRQIILRRCFNNNVLQNDFTKNKRENRINSQYENHIIKVQTKFSEKIIEKDLFHLLNVLKMHQTSFNESMVYCSKMLLCYYERINNKIPNTQLYCLAILLTKAFDDLPISLETINPICGTETLFS
jgi:uncharacterized protein YejL (UPF0352 family)